ncbi:MAG: hypothetical protein KatS3mg131_3599 [Candidatus Tectimicrobiota bacterium]|nr:MAG: hypothetical protein KatS3mg131_3599 [Candidatus Tectomicrobia bacterium]
MTQEEVLNVLRHVIDPELGINVVDLGLVYSVDIQDGHVRVAMTMTTPACPLHDYLLQAAEAALWQHLPEVQSVHVELVWDPPWQPTMMSEAAKRQLEVAR